MSSSSSANLDYQDSSQNNSNQSDCSKLFIEMKSIQPYSTKDEYIYAMKEDLAEWFNLMYASNINAYSFVEELENGVMICNHANNVMRAAATSDTVQFSKNDLGLAGIAAKAGVTAATPNSKNSNWTGEYLLYKPNAKPQSFQARDNISNFIKWCRHIVKVREVLMFETDDLILRKNEKHFILCLLEVARFGSKFGIQVPTIIQLEQEIEAELALEHNNIKNNVTIKTELITNTSIFNDEVVLQEQCSSEPDCWNDDTNNNSTNNSSSSNQQDEAIIQEFSVQNTKKFHTIYDSSNNNNKNNNDDDEKYNSNDSLEDISQIQPLNSGDEIMTNREKENVNKITSSISSLSSLSSYSNKYNPDDNNNDKKLTIQNQEEITTTKFLTSVDPTGNFNMDSVCNSLSSYSPSYLSPMSSSSSIALSSGGLSGENQPNSNEKTMNEANSDLLVNMNTKEPSLMLNDSFNNDEPMLKQDDDYFTNNKLASKNQMDQNNIVFNSNIPRLVENGHHAKEVLAKPNQRNNSIETTTSNSNGNSSSTNLHKHVCSIANRCTCEKKFLVDKIGEGKYKIGNTKNIVFIRILRNHIMVRVGGGWDTLENYLNKHDPCRCPGDIIAGIKAEYFNNLEENSQRPSQNHSILLKPVNSVNSSNKKSMDTTNPTQPIEILSNAAHVNKTPKTANNVHHNHNHHHHQTVRPIDFTDAQLLIKRDNQGKHIVGKILLTNNQQQSDLPQSNSSEMISGGLTLNPTSNQNSLSNGTNKTPSLNNFINKPAAVRSVKSTNLIAKEMTTNGGIKQIISTPINNNSQSIKSLIKPNSLVRHSISETNNLSDLKNLNKILPSKVKANLFKATVINDNKIKEQPCVLYNCDDVGSKTNQENDGFDFEESNQFHKKSKPTKTYSRSKTDLLADEDSLESDSININNDSFQLDDSLDESLTNESIVKNFVINSQSNLKNINAKRPLWDKTRHEPEIMNFKYLSNKKNQNETSNSLSADLNSVNINSKKAQNLNLVKQKLYLMKKSIDAKVNLADIDVACSNNKKPEQLRNSAVIAGNKTKNTSNGTVSSNTRTTPRRVKKRAEERSMTAGLFLDSESTSLNPRMTRTPVPSMTQTPSMKNVNSSLNNKKISVSLHNLATNSNARSNETASSSSSRNRHDSYCSNYSVTSTISTVTPNEYKENKAYELRKKAALLNRISKTSYDSTIYAKSHSISTPVHPTPTLTHEEAIKNSNCYSGETQQQNSFGARKRLFTKKNEPNLNKSTSKAEPNVPTKINNKQIAKNVDKTLRISNNSRSLSNSDLYFYKLDANNSKSSDFTKSQSPKLQNTIENKKSIEFKTNKTSGRISSDNIKHKRSQSLPSYKNIPMINIIDYDEENNFLLNNNNNKK